MELACLGGETLIATGVKTKHYLMCLGDDGNEMLRSNCRWAAWLCTFVHYQIWDLLHCFIV